MTRRAALAGAAALVLVACGTPTPSVSQPSVVGSSSASPGISLPEPGRPYDGDAVLEAMRASRRPGGVPDEIETTGVAIQVAATLWTFDGRVYPSLAIGGSCGPASCTLEVSGQPAEASGADLVTLAVARPAGAVTVTATDLHGYPAALDERIEAVARDGVGEERLSGLAYAAATWQLPPRSGTFWAAFRSGGEEGSPGLDVLVDLTSGTVIDTRAP